METVSSVSHQDLLLLTGSRCLVLKGLVLENDSLFNLVICFYFFLFFKYIFYFEVFIEFLLQYYF